MSVYEQDLDSFLDLDHSGFTPSAATPDLSKGKAVLNQRPSLSTSNSSSYMSNQSQQTFSGPSFRYDSYRQQTGLPPGGLANTIALNQATGLQYYGNQYGFVMPTETLNIPNIDDFDFNSQAMDMSEMDFDTDSPSLLYSSAASSSSSQFVNPNALLSQEDSPITPTAPIRRIYPGMHTEQAAQAKAQQAQKQEMLRQQQQQRQLAGQKPLPSQPKAQPAKDPHVEESISRLLHQMRQNSVASTEDDAATPTGNVPNLSRARKDEEDMDEDERLLASEEGKKLSSKERRQLRNKVSARAFRSRRKEYIGQLEGEVAVKTHEAEELKTQIRQLKEENTRLTDLTRMLLSSPAFSGFLNELSTNGMPAPPSTTVEAQPQPQPTKKDVNPNSITRQHQGQQAQIGMAMIPETTLDFSMLEAGTIDSWTNGMNNFQVCAVTEIPEGPIIDSTILSEKTSSVFKSYSAPTKDLPALEVPPVLETQPTPSPVISVNEEVELDETAFALFVDTPKSLAKPTNEPPNSLGSTLSKKSSQFQLVLHDPASEAKSLARLECICAALDATCERLAAVTSHL